jgi:ribulose bisphosphate carboxylase small subunit
MHYKESTDMLVEAADLVTEDRKVYYGDFKKNHENIASMWSIILNKSISADQVCKCMAAVKLCRASVPGVYVRDNYVDAAAYITMAGALHSDKNGDLHDRSTS